jgi:hypothetical protein
MKSPINQINWVESIPNRRDQAEEEYQWVKTKLRNHYSQHSNKEGKAIMTTTFKTSGTWLRRLCGIDKGTKTQIKGIEYQFNKIIAKISPHIGENMAFRTSNRHDQKRTSPHHIIVNMSRVQNKERILKASWQKCWFLYVHFCLLLLC